MKTLKKFLLLMMILCIVCAAFALCIGAEYVSLWDRKPTGEPISSGYTLGNSTSNIKWEVYDIGTDEEPNYTIYFSVDTAISSETVISSKLTTEWAGNNSYGQKDNHPCENHPFYDKADGDKPAGEIFGKIRNIAIEDGITALKMAAFVGMYSVEMVEMPSTLKSMNGQVFKGMVSLTTVYTRGNTPVEGTADFSNVTTYFNTASKYLFAGCKSVEHYIFPEENFTTGVGAELAKYAFYGNTSLKSIVLPKDSRLTKISASAFENCTSLEEIKISGNIKTFDSTAFTGCSEFKIETASGTAAQQYALDNGYDIIMKIYDNGTLFTTVIYDTSEDTLIFDRNDSHTSWTALSMYDSALKSFLAGYKDLASAAIFDSFKSITVNQCSLFTDFTKLEKIIFTKNDQRIEDQSWNVSAVKGLFAGCSALTTVYFGAEDEAKNGVVDLSGMVIPAAALENSTYLMFSGCPAIENVILPSVAGKVQTNTFVECKKLECVTIPSAFTEIADGAFDNADALKRIDLYAPASIIKGSTFTTASDGVVIYCSNNTDARAINAVLVGASVPTSSVMAFEGGMTIPGYSVRIEKSETADNGLRTHFAFDETVFDGTDYTLVEYGTLSATEANWNTYSESFGGKNSILSLNGTEFTSPTKVVKTAVYKNGEYINNSNHSDKTDVTFTVTIINFSNEAQYKAELVSCGYEIWEKDGEYFVLYTRENMYGYDTVSLYKTTIGMLSEGAIDIEINEESPVWNVLSGCEKTEIVLDNADIKGMLFADPINEGKFIAVYASSKNATFQSYGLSEDEMLNVSKIVIGKNIISDIFE